MRKSTRLLAIFLSVLMTVSVFPMDVFAVRLIERVDTKIVTETVFPDTVSVAQPVFYPELTVNGGETVAVDWVCIDDGGYKNKVKGTYHFQAVPTDPDYEFADGVAPVITVKVAAATLKNTSANIGFAPTADNSPVPYVVKGVSGKNVAYDATGFNALDTARSSAAMYFAGSHKDVSGAKATVGATSITVTDGANVSRVFGGGYGGTMTHTGDTNIYINNAKVGEVYGGGSGANATVNGNPYIDISGYVDIGTIYGSGLNKAKVGVITLNIHDLDSTSTIDVIKRVSTSTTAGKLMVKLDDTSKRLLTGGIIVTDASTEIYINNERYKATVAETSVTDISDYIEKGKASSVLPTTFGGVSGFVWTGNDSVLGEQTFILTAPTGYFFDGLVKTKEYTVRIVEEVVRTTGVDIEEESVTLMEQRNLQLTAKVLPDDAGNKHVTWSSDAENIATVDANGVVTAINAGEATVTVTTEDGGFTDTCVVTVTPAIAITDVNVNGLVFDTVFPINTVEIPMFYSNLTVTTDGVTAKLSGFTWVCENYNFETAGEYVFKAVAPYGYKWADGVEVPAITVNVVKAAFGRSSANLGFAPTEDTAPLPYVVKGDSGINGFPNVAYDATGCNALDAERTAGAYYFGGSHKDVAGAKATVGTVNLTVTDGANVTRVFGGGYGGTMTHTGDINVYVNNATISECIYSGGSGANTTVKGNPTIDISGYVTIGTIYGGGLNGSKVNGTTTVNIHNLEAGSSIDKIVRGSATKLVVNITSSDAVNAETIVSKIENYVTDANTSVYVDGKLVLKVTDFEMPLKTVYNTALGTETDNIGLPTQLKASVNGQTSTVNNITWVSENYDATTPGKYIFTPVVSDTENISYDMSESNLDEISVIVRVLTGNPILQITEFAPIEALSVSLGTTREQLPLPSTVKATADGQQVSVEVDQWSCTTAYDGTAYGAEYTFTATVSGEYSHQVSAPTVVVKITSAKITEIYLPVTETTLPRGLVDTPVFYDTLKVKLDNGTVTELSGFKWTVEDYNKNSLGTYKAGITTIPTNYEFAATLNVPTITVKVVNTKYDVGTTDGYIYLYGIPTVIDGNNNETYLYDITGCNKLSSTNIKGKTIFGGGPAGTASIKTVTIEMRGGNVSAIHGGSRNRSRITDTAYIYILGGTVASVYGSGSGGSSLAERAVTQNTYMYVENANVSGRLTAASTYGHIPGNGTIIVKNSKVASLFCGSYGITDDMSVDGTVTLKLLDGAQVTSLYGSGRAASVNEVEMYFSKNATVSGFVNPTGLAVVNGVAKIFYEKGFDLSTVHTEEENVKLYEGHFLADRETFVTDREIKVIRQAGLVRSDFYVDYGTKFEDIGLPTSVEGYIDGVCETVEGITYTPVKDYDGNVSGRYEFKLSIPDGYNVPPTIMANAQRVTVVVADANQSGTITAIQAENTTNMFANGTAMENIGLPSAYTATVSGQTKKVPVKNWMVTDENGRTVEFDRSKAGTYVFTPEFAQTYQVSAQVPTYTVRISEHKPVNLFNVRYLNGIPAEISRQNNETLITDKNGNYLTYAGQNIVVYAGSDSSTLDFTDVTLNGGSIKALYGGSKQKDVTGNTKVTVNGGTVTTIYAAGAGGSVEGADVTINGGTVTAVYGSYTGSVKGRVNYEVNGGTIAKLIIGTHGGNTDVKGSAQTEDELLAVSSVRYPDKPIVVKEGEVVSAVFVQNGGTIKSLYGGGNSDKSRMNGSVKIYLNGGTASTVCGSGYVANATVLGNVYIKVSEEAAANVESIVANAPGSVYGKAYVILPEGDLFNRYDIVGWNEYGEASDDSMSGGNIDDGEIEEDEGATGTEYTSAEVVVSGGYYKEGVPVRVLYMGAAQTVYAYGVPVRITGETELNDEEETYETNTYVWYFEESETGTETFSYETYVDEAGNPITLTGNWKRIDTPLVADNEPVVYGGGMQGTTDKYPSTYVEFNGGRINGIYGGGRNDTMGTANVILNADNTATVNHIYGGGNVGTRVTTNKAYVKVLGGSYNTIIAGGNLIKTKSVHVDVCGGNIKNIFLGARDASGIVGGEATLNLENCTVENIYGGGYDSATRVVGAVYINVNDNVNITGTMYPMGGAKISNDLTSGLVRTKAYVTLNDKDSTSAQFKLIKYTKSQAPNVYVNGVAMAEKPETTIAPFETAEKKVEVVTGDPAAKVTGRMAVYLNGIPTVIAGDGNGHSYLYQAKTKDGTLNVYQKNEDGTFKYDEDGKRISNIIRDSVTGQAIKGSKLIDLDVADYVVYGGAVGKSVEDTYVEFHHGGGVNMFYAGCRGGNAGYDAQGNEVGLVEARMFDAGPFFDAYIGNTLGYDIEGNQSVNTMCSKTVFIGVEAQPLRISMAGAGGIYGSEEKFLDGYYNKAGEVVEYTDVVDGTQHTVTGTWEEHNADVSKEDYEAYYESYNAYFNGDKNSTDFVNSKYYVDPYDDHYTAYCLLGAVSTFHLYMGSYITLYDLEMNRVFGNRYVRQTAYGLKYDAGLDMFVEDYNDYLGHQDAFESTVVDGCRTGVMYNDVRHDWEAVKPANAVLPLGYESKGSQNFGHTYMNLYETDDNAYLSDENYNMLYTKQSPKLTINKDFFPRWSFTSAWALGIDECMPKLAIDMGYITEVSDPKDVRIHMLSADDAAELLNYYYTGQTDEFVTLDNMHLTRGYREVFDASEDRGKFTTRMFEVRNGVSYGKNRFVSLVQPKNGDGQLITFPNGETMLIDSCRSYPDTLIQHIKYYLESAKEAGIGDGKTIDYIMVSHYHNDHDGNMSAIMKAFDFKNVILPPYDYGVGRPYYTLIEAKSEQNITEGKEPINIIRVKRGDKLVIGEGDEAVVMNVLNPGDNTYKTWTLEQLIRKLENGTSDSASQNESSIAVKFEYKGQSYFTGGDIMEYAEVSMLRSYGADYLKSDVMKFSHHGFSTSNIWGFMNAVNPDVILQPAAPVLYAAASPAVYCMNNNTGGYAEDVFMVGVAGNVKVSLDGEKVTSVTQYQNRAFERDTDEYKDLTSNYTEILDRVEDTREALTVVADNATAPYGTPHIWNSYANYIDAQLEELSKRYYSGTMTIDMLEDYTEMMLDLEDFIDDATMYGGTDNTPDVEVPGTPGTDVGGNDTTTPGTSGGIIGDIGGGDAGSGIGGGAAPGGAVVGPAGPSVDDGETEDNRRFIDVAETDWFNKAVNYVADNNYFQGVSENEFDPDGKMTRAMLVTVIGRIAKADVTQAKSDFADVADGSWYADYVAWAAEKGIVPTAKTS
ncbi:MAG: Ig-like domain-containing protein, partial [Clostridia bacterium]|nr:Ig-like domain-containing protein [Clostridia bacterium]